MPMARSSRSSTASESAGSKNDGQPQWLSNFVSLRNSSAPHGRHSYTPVVFVSVYSPVNGRSVPAWRSTAYSSGLSCACHSCSDFTTRGVAPTTGFIPFTRSTLRREPGEGVHHDVPCGHDHAEHDEDHDQRRHPVAQATEAVAGVGEVGDAVESGLDGGVRA